MKIIELLNKIANNEEVPKKIKVSCYEFEWREGGRYYANTIKGNYQTLLQDWLNNANKLNSEVEIIEDEEEIDIQSIEHEDVEIVQEILGKCDLWKGNEEYILKVIKENNNRIVDAVLKLTKENRTIIKAVKQLDKKVNSIEQK